MCHVVLDTWDTLVKIVLCPSVYILVGGKMMINDKHKWQVLWKKERLGKVKKIGVTRQWVGQAGVLNRMNN